MRYFCFGNGADFDYLLHYLSYSFEVLENAWAIHYPHQPTPYYHDFLQNLEQRLRNRAQRFAVLAQIIRKYRVRLPECDAANNHI